MLFDGVNFSRNSVVFASIFLAMALIYGGSVGVAVHIDEHSMMSRYETLKDVGRYRAAGVYGRRIIAHRQKSGASDESLAPFKVDLASTMVEAGDHRRGAGLYEDALATNWSRKLPAEKRAALEGELASASIVDGELDRGVEIFATFLALSGDQSVSIDNDGKQTHIAPSREAAATVKLQSFYAKSLIDAATIFADAFRPLGNPEGFDGGREAKLISADNMAELGAFYALRDEFHYAAAGLLSSSYELRKAILGGDHQDTVQVAMILGPVYKRLGRLEDAERLYLEAFHAQEKAKGSNSPDLSLYIKLLAGVYEDQGRATEAQALYVHMRDLFRDAFGEQRYSANRARDRSLDVDRPVSQFFVLPESYSPGDLVSASTYSVPLSKSHDIDEMKLRLAADIDREADPREENLPARLAQLISLCRSETGERLSLRSGFRSFLTQRGLFGRLGHKGTVTPPGMSEHQLGLAADIDVDGRLMRQSDKSFRCFEENAFRFGFILSYPPGNNYLPTDNSFEPWHWRYVGVRTAQLYREAGPLNRPQEFLSALECYEERARSGAFPIAGETDICLGESSIETVANGVKIETASVGKNTLPGAKKAANKLTGDETLLKVKEEANR